jgi:hypothetical protein
MQLLEGAGLSARAPIAWREACAYLRDAASILGVLHARRLVQRDLSPQKLLDELSWRCSRSIRSIGPRTPAR